MITLAFVAQALASGDSAEGVEILIPWALGLYAVAAFATRRRAFAGLALFAAGYTLYALEDRNVRVGGNDQRWSAAFWGLFALAAWLIGFVVRSRREAAAVAAEAARIESAAETALLDERSRIARELHDVIAHTVSVIGLQAGAAERMLDRDPERAREPLQSIQAARSRVRAGAAPTARHPARGRRSQPSSRRNPGWQRSTSWSSRSPRPGSRVELQIEGEAETLPPGIELSAYRIVQEALTNVLKHADATRAEVVVRYCDRSLELEVSDNGTQRDDERERSRSDRHARARGALRRHGRRLAHAGGRLLRAGTASPRGRPVVISVLIVDDEPLVRSGVRMILESEDDIEVVGEAADGKQALEQTRMLRPMWSCSTSACPDSTASRPRGASSGTPSPPARS